VQRFVYCAQITNLFDASNILVAIPLLFINDNSEIVTVTLRMIAEV